MEQLKLRKLTYAALMAAMVCVATMLIRIPTIAGYTNLGDAFILLAAFLLGPLYGAAAGGIGSMLADLLAGYASYAPGTLVIKGGIALIAALLWKQMTKKKDSVWAKSAASIVAEIWMVLGYWGYESLILAQPVASLASIPSNIAQGVVGVVLAMALCVVLKKMPFWKKIQLYA